MTSENCIQVVEPLLMLMAASILQRLHTSSCTVPVKQQKTLLQCGAHSHMIYVHLAKLTL